MKITRLAAVMLLAFVTFPARAETELTLNKSFVEALKNRVTPTTEFLIDAPKDRPNKPQEDGDLHIAGRPGANIGLMTVAEIQNAKDVADAVSFVHENKNSNSAVSLRGVWRVWFEHSGGSHQVQGSPLKRSEEHTSELQS